MNGVSSATLTCRPAFNVPEPLPSSSTTPSTLSWALGCLSSLAGLGSLGSLGSLAGLGSSAFWSGRPDEDGVSHIFLDICAPR